MTAVFTEPESGELAELAVQVWESFVDDTLVVAGSERPPGVHADGATATVSITGAWTGHLMVVMSLTAVRDLAEVMLEIPAAEVGDEDVNDVVGEVANMIGGNVKALLPEPSALGLPQVVVAARAVSLPGAAEIRSVALSWRDEPIHVSLWRDPRTGDHS